MCRFVNPQSGNLVAGQVVALSEDPWAPWGKCRTSRVLDKFSSGERMKLASQP